ncbi:MAG: aldehyde dehydrogenase family protein, partial [Desulfovibrio sp.]|nr:aldehyde dehydrogenase family protein [Desulfovibrio sp.]
MKTGIDDRYTLFIDGKWVESAGKGTFTTKNPANGEPLAICDDASAEDVDRAVAAATKAFASWKKTSPQERASLLLRIAELVDARAGHLAMVETLDN